MERIQDSQAEVQERLELVIERLSSAVAFTAEGTARVLVRLSVVATIAWILLTIAVSIYASFRYLYLPTSSHLVPVHFNYDAENGHPTALIQIVPENSYFLRSGQAYDVSVLLDVPETAVNKDLGVIMLNVELFSLKDGPVRSSQRHTMLKYKSWLQDYISTAVLWPLSLLGFQNESQELYVFMFEDFVDNPQHPVSSARIRLNKPMQIYYAQLRFDAHFSGLRHLMYWYPMTSGAIIVGVIFTCEALGLMFLYAVLLYSWAAAKRDGELDMYDDHDELDFDSDKSDEGGFLDEIRPANRDHQGVEEVRAVVDEVQGEGAAGAETSLEDPLADGLRRRL